MTTGEWQYGCLVNNLWGYAPHHSLAGQPVCEIIVCDTCDDYENMQAKDLNRTVDPKTVGQFTGLTDKNGKEIYEGDVIKGKKTYMGNYGQHRTKDFSGTVEFEPASFRVKLANQTIINRFGGSCYVFFASTDECLEVIGNIHENPELLNNL